MAGGMFHPLDLRHGVQTNLFAARLMADPQLLNTRIISGGRLTVYQPESTLIE